LSARWYKYIDFIGIDPLQGPIGNVPGLTFIWSRHLSGDILKDKLRIGVDNEYAPGTDIGTYNIIDTSIYKFEFWLVYCLCSLYLHPNQQPYYLDASVNKVVLSTYHRIKSLVPQSEFKQENCRSSYCSMFEELRWFKSFRTTPSDLHSAMQASNVKNITTYAFMISP
jgi:hypothetical protein